MYYPAFIKCLLWIIFAMLLKCCVSQMPEFRISHLNKCWPNDSYFTRRFGISLQQCVQECDNRRKCKSINYRRNVQLCELIPTTADFDDNASDTDGTCTIVHMNDIQTQNNCYSSCTEHEVCDPETGTCSVEECVPFSITNGTFLGNMNVIGSRVKLTCNIGTREENGKSISECQKNGNWSVIPQCIIVCVEPPVIDNSFFPPGEYIPGETLHYECVDNYDTTNDISDMTTTCLEDGSWSSIDITCIWDCDNPPDYPHSSIYTDIYPDIYPDYNLAGTTRHYRCDNNYSIGNDSVIMETTCEAGRYWTETNFTCYRDCGNVIIENGIAIVNNGTTITNTATINCNCGYTLYGENTLTCTQAGWDKDFPTCKAWTPQCPEGFQLYCNSCYMFDTGRYTWDKAWAKCKDEYKGNLVHIDNDAENDWLVSKCRTYTKINGFWINLSDRSIEGKWIWNDTDTEAKYTNWGQDEAKRLDSSVNCACINRGRNYQWADSTCSTNWYSAICERDPISGSGEDTPNND